MAKLYGVGVGPGDSELMTLKAVKILESADVVAVPVTGSTRTAFDIAKEYIDKNKVMECFIPMTRDKTALDAAYGKVIKDIEKQLSAGKSVAFITLGDPAVYSTYTRIGAAAAADGFETEMIPAVTSFCAAAAKFNAPLCEGSKPLFVIPADCADISILLKLDGKKAIMKAGGKFGEIKSLLNENGLLDTAKMAEKCGMDGEMLYTDLSFADENKSYFSVIIAGNEQ